ncbi:MAG: IS110 family transposase [Pseudomonadales bacterium]
MSFKCRPTLKGLVSQLEQIQKYFSVESLKLCYEASYIGHCLQRDLMQAGFNCDVISPGSIPRKGSKAIKTDRIDVLDLAQFYANDLLTIVQIPDAETEQDRDLLRSRQQLMKQQNDLRRHIQSLLRRNGLHYKAETNNKTHWTKHHYCWLERIVEGCSGSLGTNLQLLLRQLKSISEIVGAYSEEIELMAKQPNYQQAVSALTYYKGIKNLIALTMITEIGDVKRFAHPRQLSAWVGMDIREYSSGGKHHRFGITRQGNRYLRTAFIEANQRAYRTTKLSREIKARRVNTNPEYIVIADRCLKRLSKKGNRLLEAGKHPNKVKVACAREMIGFVWESLNKVAA